MVAAFRSRSCLAGLTCLLLVGTAHADVNPELLLQTGHAVVVVSAVFSPDGTRVVTASWDHTATVWDARTGQRLFSLTGHTGWVNSATFSRDGSRVLTGSSDNTAAIWDTRNGDKLLSFKGHTGGVGEAVFSPDERMVLTAARDGTTRLWEAGDGAELVRLISAAGQDWLVCTPEGCSTVRPAAATWSATGSTAGSCRSIGSSRTSTGPGCSPR